MIDSLMPAQAYYASKHVELSLLAPLERLSGYHVNPMPRKRYVAHSRAATDMRPFHQLVEDRFADTKANTIFANLNMQRHEAKDDLMQLLQEHIEHNTVRIGKRFYRQKTGIPQGSVLSSILCNFFYAELERDVLDFTLGKDCLLLRLLDDFLLITITEEHAKQFVHVMHKGHPEYGVVVQPAKSLVNFDVALANGQRIATSDADGKFPYCGVCIDTTTLEVSKKTDQPEKAGKQRSPRYRWKRRNTKCGSCRGLVNGGSGKNAWPDFSSQSSQVSSPGRAGPISVFLCQPIGAINGMQRPNHIPTLH